MLPGCDCGPTQNFDDEAPLRSPCSHPHQHLDLHRLLTDHPLPFRYFGLLEFRPIGGRPVADPGCLSTFEGLVAPLVGVCSSDFMTPARLADIGDVLQSLQDDGPFFSTRLIGFCGMFRFSRW